MAKQLTRDQVQSRKDAAVRFLENVKNDEARAAEVEDEDLESYAERRGFTIVDNPRGVKTKKKDDQLMNPNDMSKTELLDYVSDLEQENEDLQDQLDAVADIVAGPPDDDDDGSD